MPEEKEISHLMDKKTKKWFFAVVIVIILFIGFLIFSFNNAGAKYDAFAKCLTDKGIKMYGAFWCSACAQQKQIFGKSFEKINYVECSLPSKQQNDLCNSLGIQSYPTWEFADSSRQTGVLTIQQLSAVSGCSLTDA